jgi:hypothetical protein
MCWFDLSFGRFVLLPSSPAASPSRNKGSRIYDFFSGNSESSPDNFASIPGGNHFKLSA